MKFTLLSIVFIVVLFLKFRASKNKGMLSGLKFRMGLWDTQWKLPDLFLKKCVGVKFLPAGKKKKNTKIWTIKKGKIRIIDLLKRMSHFLLLNKYHGWTFLYELRKDAMYKSSIADKEFLQFRRKKRMNFFFFLLLF